MWQKHLKHLGQIRMHMCLRPGKRSAKAEPNEALERLALQALALYQASEEVFTLVDMCQEPHMAGAASALLLQASSPHFQLVK